MDIHPLIAGTALSLVVTLRDGNGQPIRSYSANTPLQAQVWPGGSRAASFPVLATWEDAASGVVGLIITPTATVALPTGRYRGELILFDPSAGPVVAYEWAIDLQAAPGSEVEPPSYCTYADLLTYGRSWLPALATDDTEAGFGRERGRARSWLDDLILARCPTWLAGQNTPGTAGYNPFAGLFGGGRVTPNIFLRSLLDADCLFRRHWVIEATAKKALSLVCEGQIGPDDDKYRKLGNRYANEAMSIAGSSVAEIGYPPCGVEAGGIRYVGAPPVIFGEPYPMFSINLGAGSVR